MTAQSHRQMGLNAKRRRWISCSFPFFFFFFYDISAVFHQLPDAVVITGLRSST